MSGRLRLSSLLELGMVVAREECEDGELEGRKGEWILALA
jgi:hypothetical protein